MQMRRALRRVAQGASQRRWNSEKLSADEVRALRQRYSYPSIVTYYKKALVMERGEGQFLYDVDGKKYLDFIAGIVTAAVGHSHPKVNAAMKQQIDKLIHTTSIYANAHHVQFMKELVGCMPPPKSGDSKDEWVVFMTNTGSEANDLAMLLARAFTKSFDIIALRNGYHGFSEGTRALTALNTWRHSVPTMPGIRHSLNPDPYRGLFGDDGPAYAADVKNIIDFDTPGKVAAFIAEPIQGVGGGMVPPDGYFEAVYEHVRNANGLLISDEVQTGFGRTGDYFWGIQTLSKGKCIPDIFTMAKGIANGYPCGALVTRREIAASIADKTYFNTYAGNPLQCATALATLNVIKEEKLQERSKETGDRLLNGLRKLQSKHDLIGHVRGRGLMVGFELVTDRKKKTPAKDEASAFFEETRERGLLLGKGGLYGTCFRVKPPMCITNDDVDHALDIMDQSFEKITRG